MVVFNNQAVSRLEGGANQLSQRVTDGELGNMSYSSYKTYYFSNHCMAITTADETEEERLQTTK